MASNSHSLRVSEGSRPQERRRPLLQRLTLESRKPLLLKLSVPRDVPSGSVALTNARIVTLDH